MRGRGNMQLGIDFGTTRTVVACVDRGNYPVVHFEDNAGDACGFIPSLIAEKDGELCFGFDAAAALDNPAYTALPSIKRLLSRTDAGPGQTVKLGTSTHRVVDLIAGFLSYVRQALLDGSSVKSALSRPPPHARTGGVLERLRAVVGIPANAHGAARLVTLDAFRSAGFEVMAMLNEPSAAGFEYTHRHRDTMSSKRDSVVVYDLGGGTFDASLVRMTGAHHAVLATAGHGRLGGDDFDAALANTALSQVGLGLEALPLRAAQGLLAQCRDAKERLNPNSRKITLDLEALLGKSAPRAELTVGVADFYDACLPLIVRTIETMHSVLSSSVTQSRAGAEDAALAEVAGLYVVGGASELPVVARTLREHFGRRVHRSPHPSAAVAIGLAIAADEHAGFALTDRYSRTFGVFREAESGHEITFDPIFTRDTELPPSKHSVSHTRTYRAAHNVGHFRFFECTAAVGGGKPHGDMALFGDVYFPFDARLAEGSDLARVPVERRGDGDEGPRIFERYSLDENGIVDVLIRNLDSGHERTYRL